LQIVRANRPARAKPEKDHVSHHGHVFDGHAASASTRAAALPSERTPEQNKALLILSMKAKSSQDTLDKILGAGSNEDERMNANLDIFVKKMIMGL
jgi:hypothetical protein